MNADKLTAAIGRAIAKTVGKNTSSSFNYRWQVEITLDNGDVLELSEW